MSAVANSVLDHVVGESGVAIDEPIAVFPLGSSTFDPGTTSNGRSYSRSETLHRPLGIRRDAAAAIAKRLPQETPSESPWACQ